MGRARARAEREPTARALDARPRRGVGEGASARAARLRAEASLRVARIARDRARRGRRDALREAAVEVVDVHAVAVLGETACHLSRVDRPSEADLGTHRVMRASSHKLLVNPLMRRSLVQYLPPLEFLRSCCPRGTRGLPASSSVDPALGPSWRVRHAHVMPGAPALRGAIATAIRAKSAPNGRPCTC